MTTIASIIAAVATEFGVKPSDITGPSRQTQHVEPRYVAIRLARELTGKSPAEIGRAFRRDRSSVYHALSRPLTIDGASRLNRLRLSMRTEHVRADTMHVAQIAALGAGAQLAQKGDDQPANAGLEGGDLLVLGRATV